MPVTLQQNLINIELMLDEPSEGSPSTRILWQLLQDQVTHHQTALQNTSAQWDVASWTLTTVQGQEDYLITATDFGKAFWIYTFDPTQPWLPRVEIPFAMLQNADMFYQGPAQPYTSSSNLFTASTIAFYRSAGSWYARVTPIPGGSVSYVIFYETAPGPPYSLGDSPGLSPFVHLIRAKTALNALPYCGWGSLRVDADDPKKAAAWDRKVKALGAVLAGQAADYQKQFDTYIATLSNAGVERRQAFGDSYLNSSEIVGTGLLSPNQFGL